MRLFFVALLASCDSVGSGAGTEAGDSDAATVDGGAAWASGGFARIRIRWVRPSPPRGFSGAETAPAARARSVGCELWERRLDIRSRRFYKSVE